VDNLAQANNDLIASHIVTCFLESSTDVVEGSSTLTSGWTGTFCSDSLITHVLVISFFNTFSTSHVSV